MIISHKHKFIFIKTEKTAGTSIEIALSKICGKNDIITPITKEDEKYRKELGYNGPQNYFFPLKNYSKKDLLKAIYFQKRQGFYNHISAQEIKQKISPCIWNSYYKFCFERNPFDKVISLYYWLLSRNEIEKMTIEQFIKSGHASNIRGYDLYSISNIPVVDNVYKFEEISFAFKDLNSRLNLNGELMLPPKKTKGNSRKDKRHYRDIIAEKEALLLSKIFARELVFFDYNF